jgi:hypothetical protein
VVACDNVSEEQLGAVKLVPTNLVLDSAAVAGGDKTLYYIRTPGRLYKVRAMEPLTHYEGLVKAGRLASACEYLDAHEELQ